jgi:DNA-binding transcriptional MerR regulator
MAELTRASGVPTATIKYYLREGLLQPGERTAPNQATYGERHLRRLRLIRALREVGGLKIGTIGRILASMETAEAPWDMLGELCDAIGESDRDEAAHDPEWLRAARDVDGFLASRGLPTRTESTSRAQLIEALVAIRGALGSTFPVEGLEWYSDAVRNLARKEIGASRTVMRGEDGEGWSPLAAGPPGTVDLQAMLEVVVYGTVLFEPVLLAFRRLWQEHYAEAEGLAQEVSR